jgi:hypothetical protein
VSWPARWHVSQATGSGEQAETVRWSDVITFDHVVWAMVEAEHRPDDAKMQDIAEQLRELTGVSTRERLLCIGEAEGYCARDTLGWFTIEPVVSDPVLREALVGQMTRQRLQEYMQAFDGLAVQ